jgi:hypothetical protein
VYGRGGRRHHKAAHTAALAGPGRAKRPASFRALNTRAGLGVAVLLRWRARESRACSSDRLEIRRAAAELTDERAFGCTKIDTVYDPGLGW